MIDYIVIGKTYKAVGLKGELKFQIDDPYVEDFDAANVVYLKVMGNPLPYFIESVKADKTPLIKFEDVNSPEEAKLITTCDIMMKASDLKNTTEEFNEDDYSWLKGFNIHEEEKGEVGKIIEVIEFPQQEMALVDFKGQEIYIPLNEAFISEIKEQSKVIIMKLPEGLLDL